ncbi:MAG: hypothetical protein Q8880_12330 [Bacteroidota bacterium]|nr:hypothetical protein [Bacteroidota bacterium]
MSTKIQLKRGLEKDLPTLSEGELGFTTDTWKLFVGSSNGNIQLAKMSDITGATNHQKYTTWTATTGQITYVFDSDSYTVGQGQLSVYVGGVIQIPTINFTETSPTSFTLTCDASEITSGLNVVAIYR